MWEFIQPAKSTTLCREVIHRPWGRLQHYQDWIGIESTWIESIETIAWLFSAVRKRKMRSHSILTPDATKSLKCVILFIALFLLNEWTEFDDCFYTSRLKWECFRLVFGDFVRIVFLFVNVIDGRQAEGLHLVCPRLNRLPLLIESRNTKVRCHP